MATPPVFSAGAVLTAAQMNAVGLWLVKTDTITSGSSKEITSAFNSDFTNYRIVLQNIQLAAFDSLVFRFGTTATGYYGSLYYDKFDGTATSTNRYNNAIGAQIGYAENTTGGGAVSFDVYGPQTTTSRKIIAGNYYGGGYAGWFGELLVSSTQFTSFTIYTGGGTNFTTCNVNVFGYRK